MVAFILSFAFGAVLAALMPVVAFLAIVALAGAVSVGVAVAHGGASLTSVLRVSGEAVCAQLGYIAGIVSLAFLIKTRASPPSGTADRRDSEDKGI